MHERIKVCVIGDGTHSKRIQKILKSKKLKFFIFKPKSKKNFKKENLDILSKYNVFFIISPNGTHYHYIKSLNKKGYNWYQQQTTKKTFPHSLSLFLLVKQKIYSNHIISSRHSPEFHILIWSIQQVIYPEIDIQCLVFYLYIFPGPEIQKEIGRQIWFIICCHIPQPCVIHR